MSESIFRSWHIYTTSNMRGLRDKCPMKKKRHVKHKAFRLLPGGLTICIKSSNILQAYRSPFQRIDCWSGMFTLWCDRAYCLNSTM